MAMSQVSKIYDMMGLPHIKGQDFVDLFEAVKAPNAEISLTSIPYEEPEDTSKYCDFIKIKIKGVEGKSVGGKYPTMGLIGRLGAQQAQPHRIGIVSDADGSIVVLASALELLQFNAAGGNLQGDVIITTHIATHVSITPHDPVDFMGVPVSSETMNKYEVDSEMDAVLSVDTSKGNSIIKHRGIAISPTAKEGYILRVSPDLVSILECAIGEPAHTFPITIQDITPYENDFYHFNSIMQPTVATEAPVIGVAITAKSVVPGCATGGSYESELTDATVFTTEVTKQFTSNKITFFDKNEYDDLVRTYGNLKIFQTTPILK